MKPYLILAASLSLVVNLALGIAIYDARMELARTRPPRPSVSSYGERLAARKSRLEKLRANEVDSAKPLSGGIGYQEIVNRLNSDGIPPRVIRQTIGRLLEEDFDSKVRAFLANDELFNRWKTAGPRALSEEQREILKAMVRQMNQQSATLLAGLPILDDPASRLRWERQLGAAIPWDKYVETARIAMDYSEVHRSIELAPGNADHRIEHQLLEQEQRKDLEALLSPEELEEYDLRYSPAASQIKARIGNRTVTEEEFRDLFRQQRALENKMAGQPGGRS